MEPLDQELLASLGSSQIQVKLASRLKGMIIVESPMHLTNLALGTSPKAHISCFYGLLDKSLNLILEKEMDASQIISQIM